MRDKFNTKETDERKSTVQSYWREGVDGNKDWKERKERAFKYYKSVQWTQEDLDTLKDEGRPALVFNFIKSIIRNLSGYQRDNKQSTKVFARKNATGILAEIFTETIKAIEDGCNALYEKAFAFLYGTIGGKSYVSIDVEYNDDPIDGDWVIQSEDPDGVVDDPKCKAYDMNKGGRFIFRHSMYTKERLELEFPKADFSGLEAAPMNEDDREAVATGYGDKYREVPTNAGDSAAPTKRYTYRVKECQWKTWKNKKYLIDIQTLDVMDISHFNWKKKALREKLDQILAQNPAKREVDRVVPVLNLTIMVAGMTLQDIEDPFNGVSKFLIVRYCPDFILGHAKGEVEDLQDPQDEVNKRYSQTLHHLNRSANSGWVVDADAFTGAGTSTWKDLEKFGSKGGTIIRKKPNSTVKQIDPTPISQGHLLLADKGPDTMKRISGTNPDMMGEVSDPDLSGIAMRRRTLQGQITTRVIHENWAYTEKILGETLLELIRKTDIISGQEIMSLVQEKHLQFNGQPITAEMIEQALGNRAIGKYGVTVGLSSSSPTAMLNNFEVLAGLAKNGLPIPPNLLIENSSLSAGDKEKAIQYMEAQQKAQQELIAEKEANKKK